MKMRICQVTFSVGRQSEAQTALVDLIYRIITSPQQDIARLLAVQAPQAHTGPLPTTPQRPHQVLPHVSIGDVTGLLELVQARGGREDLYQLGRYLHLDLDDLLPVVEAADVLELADTEEGDLVLTEAGKHFAEAGVLEEKQIFREQALAHVSLLRQIVQALEQAPGHSLPEEYFLSLLEKHFSEQEAQEQLETVINWGRYAELFTFNEDLGLFRLEEAEADEKLKR